MIHEKLNSLQIFSFFFMSANLFGQEVEVPKLRNTKTLNPTQDKP